MKNKNKFFVKWITFFVALFSANSAYAIFLIFPIPNLGFPAQLQRTIESLEKSGGPKALAHVSEDRLFGEKNWIWGHHASGTSQIASEATAMRTCENALANAKNERIGDQPKYDFGKNKCVLYEFNNKFIDKVPEQPVIQVKPLAVISVETKPVEVTETIAIPKKDNVRVDGSSSPVAKKLRELQELLKDRLINENEYNIKRKEILEKM